jgi:hypothetical protein
MPSIYARLDGERYGSRRARIGDKKTRRVRSYAVRTHRLAEPRRQVPAAIGPRVRLKQSFAQGLNAHAVGANRRPRGPVKASILFAEIAPRHLPAQAGERGREVRSPAAARHR